MQGELLTAAAGRMADMTHAHSGYPERFGVEERYAFCYHAEACLGRRLPWSERAGVQTVRCLVA